MIRDGVPVELSTAEVAVDPLLVRPGAEIAVGGVVEDWESEVDESMVAGESLPVHKQSDSPADSRSPSEASCQERSSRGYG